MCVRVRARRMNSDSRKKERDEGRGLIGRKGGRDREGVKEGGREEVGGGKGERDGGGRKEG